MCDFSGRLIAWLDDELPFDEAAVLERHVQACKECRSSLDSYKQVTRAFKGYCDATMALTARRRLLRLALVLSGTVAVVAALLLALPRAPVKQTSAHPPAAVAPATAVFEATPAPRKRIHRRRAVAPVRSQDANWVQSEPSIHIAIPAEAMFAPGAIPEGITLFADVSIAADGSAQRLRLRP